MLPELIKHFVDLLFTNLIGIRCNVAMQHTVQCLRNGSEAATSIQCARHGRWLADVLRLVPAHTTTNNCTHIAKTSNFVKKSWDCCTSCFDSRLLSNGSSKLLLLWKSLGSRKIMYEKMCAKLDQYSTYSKQQQRWKSIDDWKKTFTSVAWSLTSCARCQQEQQWPQCVRSSSASSSRVHQ